MDNVYSILIVILALIAMLYSLPFKENIIPHRGKHIRNSDNESPCSYILQDVHYKVDCSGRSLQSVYRSWFPENTNEIMLQNNLLTRVPNNTLNDLNRLQRLSLQNNKLNYIEANAFQRLYNLNYLNLESNNLDLFRLPENIFSDLISLTELRLAQNDNNAKVGTIHKASNNGSFPDHMFGYLINLRVLYVSVSTTVLYFNDEFTKLKYLSELGVTGSITNITEDSFQNVKYVTKLNLTYLEDVIYFSDLAMGAFYNISNIILSVVKIGVQKTLELFRPLKNTNVSYIQFYRVQAGNRRESSIENKDGFLTANSTKYLQLICIDSLVFQANYIYIIYRDAFKSHAFDRCLKTLYIFENTILGEVDSLIHFLKLSNLQNLGVGESEYFVWGYGDDADVFEHYTKRQVMSLNSSFQISNSMVSVALLTRKDNISSSNLREIILPISKSLTKIDMMSLFSGIQLGERYRLQGGDNVLSLNFRNNKIYNFSFPILGLSNLQALYLSSNDMSVLSEYFFDEYPMLQTLFIDNCGLSSTFLAQYSSRVFRNLPELRLLDISYNALDLLAPNTFFSNPNIAKVNLAHNRFRTIPFQLRWTPHLEYLDLRVNVIASLSSEDISFMERNKENLGHFQLFLSGNILSCGCEHLSFLQWLHSTNVSLDNNRNYTCMNSYGVLTDTLACANIEWQWRQCWGPFYLNMSIVLLCLMCSGYLLVLLWVKNKTLIVSCVLQLFTNFKLKNLNDYKYGVFIGYSDLDYQFACTTLRQFVEEELRFTTFVRDRDLLPSMSEADGIMEAMNSSWRIVLVVNKSFIDQNEWFLFTVRSAGYSITPANPSRVVVLADETCANKLPSDLLSSVQEDNIILVTEWHLTYSIRQALITCLK